MDLDFLVKCKIRKIFIATWPEAAKYSPYKSKNVFRDRNYLATILNGEMRIKFHFSAKKSNLSYDRNWGQIVFWIQANC